MEIARTGNFLLLVESGESNEFECLEKWETIVKRNAEENGNFEYDTYYQALKNYYLLMAEYVLVKALLTSLCFSIVYEHIEMIRGMGYKIDTTNTETYTVSLSNGLKKAENLNTKIETKRKELATMFQKDDKQEGFEQVLAHLNASLGFTTDKDITLSMFNEYKKILKAKQPKDKM